MESSSRNLSLRFVGETLNYIHILDEDTGMVKIWIRPGSIEEDSRSFKFSYSPPIDPPEEFARLEKWEEGDVCVTWTGINTTERSIRLNDWIPRADGGRVMCKAPREVTPVTSNHCYLWKSDGPDIVLRSRLDPEGPILAMISPGSKPGKEFLLTVTTTGLECGLEQECVVCTAVLLSEHPIDKRKPKEQTNP